MTIEFVEEGMAPGARFECLRAFEALVLTDIDPGLPVEFSTSRFMSKYFPSLYHIFNFRKQ